MASWLECDHFWKISAGSLSPRVATKAVTAVMMHGVKSVVFQRCIHLEQVWVLAVARARRRSTYGRRVIGWPFNSKRRSRAL